jgi:hypothetical protein
MSDSVLNYPIVIIGNTSSVTLYARKLLKSGFKKKITLLITGLDNTDNSKVKKTSYNPDNARKLLNNLYVTKFKYIHCNSDDSETINYHIPAGTNGEFVSSYVVPRVGPWFAYNTIDRKAKTFFLNSCKEKTLGTDVLELIARLANMFNVPVVSSIFTGETLSSGVLNTEYLFIEDPKTRNLFNKELSDVLSSSNVKMYTQAKNVRVNDNGNGLYDVKFSNAQNNSSISIQNSFVLWKNDPHSFIQDTATTNVNNVSIKNPVLYRYYAAIPKTNPGGLNINNLKEFDDGTTTFLTFSVPDLLGSTDSSSVMWLGQCYTTDVDYSQVSDGRFVERNSDTTILIIEALNLKFQRTYQHDSASGGNYILIDDKKENQMADSFARIVQLVYKSYTNQELTRAEVLNKDPIKTNIGIQTNNTKFTSTFVRESPLVSVMEIGLHVFNGNYRDKNELKSSDQSEFS